MSRDTIIAILLTLVAGWIAMRSPLPKQQPATEFWQYPDVMKSIRNQVEAIPQSK